MHLLEVIPIARGITKETLSYFAKDVMSPGSLVHVPLHSREIPALVVNCEDMRRAKVRIKESDYALKKISDKTPEPFIPTEYIHAAKQTARYFATTTGAVLYATIPSSLFLEGMNTKVAKETSDICIFQAETHERIAHYKSLIREAFALKNSLAFIAPTIADVERLREELQRE